MATPGSYLFMTTHLLLEYPAHAFLAEVWTQACGQLWVEGGHSLLDEVDNLLLTLLKLLH